MLLEADPLLRSVSSEFYCMCVFFVLLSSSYDAGCIGQPVMHGGCNPRWAVLCGVIVEKPPDRLATTKPPTADGPPTTDGPPTADGSPTAANDPETQEEASPVGQAWVVARTGMHDQYSVWPLDMLAASNRQMRGLPSRWFLGPAPVGAEVDAQRRRDQTHRDAFDLCQIKRARELAQRLAQGDYDFAGLERQCPHAAHSWRSACRAVRCLWLDCEHDDWLHTEVRDLLAKYGVPTREPVVRPIFEHEDEELYFLTPGFPDSPMSPPTTPPPSPSPMTTPEDLFENPCQLGHAYSLEETLACKYVVFEPIRKISIDPRQQDVSAPLVYKYT